MRRNFAFLLGTATGACLAVLVMGPQGAHLVAAAKAAARPDLYAQLNLFGNVFERIKTSYVEKPDDSQTDGRRHQRHDLRTRSSFALHE